MYDIIIIGGGPGGLSAGIYGIRSGLKVLVLDKASWGGQTIMSAEIANYPAVPSVTGPDFAQKMYEQYTQLGGEISLEEVKNLSLQDEEKIVETSKGKYSTKTVIIAAGLTRRKLGCLGEGRLLGRGVSYCAICDGRFFTGKDVAVVGGGNTAMEDALYMSSFCNQIHIICRKGELKGEGELKEAIEKKKNIHISYNKTVVEIHGENMVEEVMLEDGNSLKVAGLFVAIGYKADSGIFKGKVEMTDQGYIIGGENCETNVAGVFIAGDLRTKMVRQIVTAAADGAIAALGAANYILKCN
ncbi:MAG: FAD-dependent oxidoreductase [Anaerovoracaceae bacterium]